MSAEFPPPSPIHNLTAAPTLEHWRVVDFDNSLILWGAGPEGGVWLDLTFWDERAGWVRSRDGRLYRLGEKAPPIGPRTGPLATQEQRDAFERSYLAAMEEAYRLDPRPVRPVPDKR